MSQSDNEENVVDNKKIAPLDNINNKRFKNSNKSNNEETPTPSNNKKSNQKKYTTW